MDNATRKRLTLGFISNWISRAAGALIQLVQVPVFLHFWSKPVYGEWLIVTSVPAWLSLSNIGFGSVASNDMTMLMGRDDKQSALRVFQSCWWFIALVCAGTMLVFSLVLVFLPVASWLNISAISASDTRWMLFALGLAVLFGQLEQLMGAAFTCVGKYPFGQLVRSCITLATFVAMIVPVMLGHGPKAAAISYALSNIVGTLVFGIMARRDVPWIRFGWRYARWAEIQRMTRPAFAFMAFPLGQALNLQGTLLAVGYALGPNDVVVFGTARTVSRVALQMVQLVNQTFWPELGAAFGAGKIELVRTLHRRACQMALLIGMTLIAFMATVGPWFLTHWTLHKLPPSPGLLFVLMVSVFFYAGWSTSSTLLQAINKHQTLAGYYIFGTGLTVVVTYLAARYSGLMAAAASLILSDLIMNMYVLPASLKLAHDTWSGFLGAMFEYPQALRPARLWRRIRRTPEMPGDHGQMEI